MYPPVEPYESGYLKTGDGQELYWEQCGNPAGKPAVVLHGGPGSGCGPWMRQLFDPRKYRIVLLDQRGAGRSRPPASNPESDLSLNTTPHLVADLELLREQLGISTWLVHGVSWGSTLGLAYVQAHPQQVSEVVLAAVTMTRDDDVEWFTRGAGRFFPSEWDEFRNGVPDADREGSLAEAYARLLASHEDTVCDQAAVNWCAWEDAIVSIESGGRPSPRYADPTFRYGFARLVTHYFSHAAWLGENQLLEGAKSLGSVPAVLIHGRLDVGGPLHTAWALAQAWPGSDLNIVESSGHVSSSMTDYIVAATDRFSGA